MQFGARSGSQLGLILVCASALLGAGCKDEPSSLAGYDTQRSSAAAPTSSPAPEPEPEPEASPPPLLAPRPPLPPRDPGPAPAADSAYVGVMELGVFVLDAAGWRLHYPYQESIADMAVIDGELFMLTARGVEQIDGQGQAKLVAPFEPDGHNLPWRMGAAGADEFWVLGSSETIGHWKGSWEFMPVHPSWGDQPSGGSDIAVDHHGEPWVSWGQVRRRSGEVWTPLDLPHGSRDEVLPELVARTRAQTMVVKSYCDADTCELLRYRGPEKDQGWEVSRVDLPLEGCPEYAFLSVSDNAKYAALGGFCALLRVPLDDLETEPTRLTHAGGTWTGQMPRSLAVDDRGRIWAGTGEGLIVADGAGPATVLPSARLGDFAGDMNRLVVSGEGPPLPELGEERRGTLRARVTLYLSDEVLANTEVELCSASPGPEYTINTEASPCAGVERKWTTTTDAQGRFELSELPLAHYHIVVRVEGVWRNLFPAYYDMRRGETTELGDITVMPLR